MTKEELAKLEELVIKLRDSVLERGENFVIRAAVDVIIFYAAIAGQNK